MKPKLFLHAGTQKTGTTAIQSFCSSNRNDLANLGLCYPLVAHGDKGRDNHIKLSHAFSDRPKKFSAGQARTILEDIAFDAAKTGNTVLISAEPIWRQTYQANDLSWYDARDAYISRLADALSPFDVTLIVAFRRPDNFAQSFFLELSSRGGSKEDFKTYREKIRSTSADYWTNSSLLARWFPKCKFLIYEDLAQQGLIVPFFRHLDTDVSDLSMPGIVRKSIKPAEAVILNILKLASGQGSKRMNAWLENPRVRALTEEYLTQNGNCDLWESHEARVEYLEHCEPSLERLRSAFFIDRTQLFAPLETADTRQKLGQPDSELIEKLTELVPKLIASNDRTLGKTAAGLWRSIRTTIRKDSKQH